MKHPTLKRLFSAGENYILMREYDFDAKFPHDINIITPKKTDFPKILQSEGFVKTKKSGYYLKYSDGFLYRIQHHRGAARYNNAAVVFKDVFARKRESEKYGFPYLSKEDTFFVHIVKVYFGRRFGKYEHIFKRDMAGLDAGLLKNLLKSAFKEDSALGDMIDSEYVCLSVHVC